MTLSNISIERPVFTWMMMLALVVFGVLGYNRLGVDQFPNMEFPVVSVNAILEGAAPEGVEEDVTDVLEERLNSIAGVRTINSKTYRSGVSISVEFELGTDLDAAIQEVRDEVNQARSELPKELEPPMVSNFNPNSQPVLWIPLRTSENIVTTMDTAKRQIMPRLETIPGVSGVAKFGGLERNIRIWLNGDELRARDLAPADLLAALRREHVELPAGSLETDRVKYVVRAASEFESLAELERMVIAHRNGAPILLQDVARVEDGAEDQESVGHYNGAETVGLGIQKQSRSNTVGIVDEVLARLPAVEKTLPVGIEFEEPSGYVDFSRGVREAVSETQFALIFGALLAVFTVFVFLRRIRPTLIVALAIPISLIATFGLVDLFGFTLNTMTLLAMALAVGVVIDDAIVVLENIERHRERGEEPYQAARAGTREITFAATAATISVVAVFLPVYFVQGLVGSFLGEFGLVVAGSVLISLFVALTVTPMLAARMPPPAPRSQGGIYHRLEMAFAALERNYRRLLDLSLNHRMQTIGVAVGAMGLAYFFGSQLKGEFFPPSDQGIFFARLEAAPGTALPETLEFLVRDEEWFKAQPEIAGFFSSVGYLGDFTSPPRSHLGMVFGNLVSADERERSVHQMIEAAREELANIPGRQLRVFNPGSIMRGSNMSGFQVELRGNLSLTELDRISDEYMRALSKIPGLVDFDKSLKLGLPELRVVPDRQKAADMGVDAASIAEAIRLMVGGMDVGVFKEEGRRIDIRMRLEEQLRNNPESIGSIYVRNRDGEPVALRNLVETTYRAAPSEITRTGRQRAVTVSANMQGIKLSEAISAAQEIAESILPDGISLVPVGEAENMKEGMDQFSMAMFLGILVIYMVLAAQFESFVHPLTVMIALPLAMVGALGGLLLFGHTLNLFSMIGIILLFGLVTKNSILLIDYANQLRAGGMDKLEAMRTAAPVRMRPVLMTALSMIFGVLPAAVGLGPGAESRAPMAIATAMGMLSATLLTLLVVPVMYLSVDDGTEWLKRRFKKLLPRRNSHNLAAAER